MDGHRLIRNEAEPLAGSASLHDGGMPRDDRVLRPFWLHQAAEYLIGMVLVALGLQSLDPVVPTLAGGLVILNAALVDGPLGAFRLFSRRAHRIADLVVIGIARGARRAAVDQRRERQPHHDRRVRGDPRVRVVELVVRAAPEPARPGQPSAPVDRSEAIGRSAGRAVGGIARIVRDRTRD